MKDYLQDIVQHTYWLGFIDLVKIDGTDSETTLEGLAEDRSVILKAEFKNPVPEFMDTFGMPNLDKLGIILKLSVYEENAKISINKQERNGKDVPVGIHFENETGDFENDYRFMSSEIVNDKLKSVTMKDVGWGITFNPTVGSVQRLKMQISANADELTFTAKTENNHLVFSFGDHSTHAGSFVFQHDVGGKLSHAWDYPVEQVSKILSLPGDIVFKFSDNGVSEITVDSGLATYHYLLPAQQK